MLPHPAKTHPRKGEVVLSLASAPQKLWLFQCERRCHTKWLFPTTSFKRSVLELGKCGLAAGKTARYSSGRRKGFMNSSEV